MGLTDDPTYANQLQTHFTYTNTFYHQEPRIDILDQTSGEDGAYDFIIASEVFEHLPPPVQPAFDNLSRLLKPDGFVIFTVPWGLEEATIEHFPDLYDWKIVELRGGHLLVNRTKDGEVQTFDNLCFHGGAGVTLEMRLFMKNDLTEHLRSAGFQEIEYAESCPDHGIVLEPWSRGLVARKSPRLVK
jgi:SAM-dependent methyltransferase